MEDIHNILAKSLSFQKQLKKVREMIIANAVMIAQIPAPTFDEKKRSRFLLDRFVEAGLTDISNDDAGNVFGLIKGRNEEQTILLVGHIDSTYEIDSNFNISVTSNQIIGSGVGDNALGLSFLTILPYILEVLDLKLNSNILIMGAASSLDRGNLKGIKHYVDNCVNLPDYGIVVEGLGLGRLNHKSMGTLRGEIQVISLETQPEWDIMEPESALTAMLEVLDKLLSIPLPQRPKTKMYMGYLQAGAGFNTVPSQANLGIEVRSESDDIVNNIYSKIEDIVREHNSYEGIQVTSEIFAKRKVSVLRFTHPLIIYTLELMKGLGIEPKIGYSSSEMASLINVNVPSITLGISTGGQRNTDKEFVNISPILKGVNQLIGVLMAIDSGACYEH